MSKIVFLLGVFVIVENLINIEAKVEEDRNPHLNKVTLDKKYFLEWMVDWDERRIVFSATVATRGYVGLGLSRSGKMSGADIFIGGVFPNGKPYFSDRHAKGLHKLPVEDLSQDWILHSAWENSSHTFLSFSRKFDTCDEDHDLAINDDTVALIWAFGEKDDDFEYHYENKGSFLTHLLDPDLTPRGVSLSQTSNHLLSHGNTSKGIEIWTISGSQVLPPKDTTYICSIHKAPTSIKTHIIGFNAVLPTELDRKHIHHFILYHCGVPKGFNAEEIFEPVLNKKEICYVLSQPSGRIPTNYCTAILYVRGLGQPPLFLPEHTGVPISEEPADYFMLQMHFNNPNELPGISYKS